MPAESQSLTEKKAQPIVLIGGGGHASVVAEVLLQQGKEIIAVVSPASIAKRDVFSAIEHITSDSEIARFPPREVKLVNGIGFMPKTVTRQRINYYFLALGYQFDTVVAPTAVVSSYATLEPGSQILAGAVVQTGARIGAHSIINSKALVEHDCEIGEYNHIAPSATICGEVKTQTNVFVGAGAIVTPNVTIGENAIVGAGCCVTKSIDAGVMARPTATIFSRVEKNEGRKG